MPLFQHKPEYPVSHLSAIVQYAANQRDLKPFSAYVWKKGMPFEHIKGGPPKVNDYVIIKENGEEWASDKSFFESQYEAVIE